MKPKSAKFSLFMSVFAILLLTAVLSCVSVTAFADGDFTVDKDGVLTQYKGSAEEVVIPSNVKVIGTSAFTGKQRMVRLVIPEGVTEIRTNAFANCISLREGSLL